MGFMKKTIVILLVIFLIVGGFMFLYKEASSPSLSQIKSFEDCVDAGYPILESYPRQCNTPDGRNFVEDITPPITYVNSSKNLIEVELPYPGAVTGKEFSVIGKARGVWFFEASFPIELQDEEGNILYTAIAQAQEDWMTENFVPFTAEVKAPESYIGPAVLVFRKDNPSGEPQFDASMSFPIVVEY